MMAPGAPIRSVFSYSGRLFHLMNIFKTVTIWLVILVVCVFLLAQLLNRQKPVDLSIVQFLQLAEQYHDPAKDQNPAFVGELVDRSGKISGKLAANVPPHNTTGE